jgi:hypothetical protein
MQPITGTGAPVTRAMQPVTDTLLVGHRRHAASHRHPAAGH